MKLLHLLIGLLVLLASSGCSDSIEEPVPGQGGNAGSTDTYHDYIRQHPYPKADNELYLNPPPLIVPEQARNRGEQLQFALSRSAGFEPDVTEVSKPVPWCMYNPHRVLESGTWHWRFRVIAADGTEQPWSDAYQFSVTDDLPRFATPAVDVLFNNLPVGHPRLYCFLDSKAEAARPKLTEHPEYRALRSRATGVLRTDFSDIAAFYTDKTSTGKLCSNVSFLAQAFYLTGEEEYAAKMLEIFRLMIATPPAEKQLFASNFISTNIALAYIYIYDLLYDRLDPSQRIATEDLLLSVLRVYYKAQVGSEENHIFDSHFWQQNLRVLCQAAYMLYDKATCMDETRPMLEYYYEMWIARAPGSGYNRDGVWHNSVTYFNANVETLYYMPSLFSHLTRFNFLQHPWYKSAGRALIYSWPVGSANCSFGDGNDTTTEPYRIRIAFADFLARHLDDGYARWYASQCLADLRQDYLLRMDRMVDPSYGYDEEETLPGTGKMIWYKDAGEVVMHSDLAHVENNLSLSFRSSRYGCSAHTFANQNAFNVLYKGVNVFHNTGYYLKYGSPHHIASCRHTRAHNTILVDGIGQNFTSEAYGDVLRGIGGNHISYCLGDASRAYAADTCDLKSWVENFRAAGITQTPGNGFGTTPLTRYLRHVWMLHPDIIVIYDELDASGPVRYDWLLHSPTAFKVDADGCTFNTSNAEKGFATQAHLFSSKEFQVSQTDLFTVPPTETPAPAYPNQWHLKATVGNSRANRFLFIMQVYGSGHSPQNIRREGNDFHIGDWHIRAEMNPDNPPSVAITHGTLPVVFDYGTGNVSLPDGSVYQRKQPGSSVLYDETDGLPQLIEETDYRPKHTRSIY